jgi:hypothetical protein
MMIKVSAERLLESYVRAIFVGGEGWEDLGRDYLKGYDILQKEDPAEFRRFKYLQNMFLERHSRALKKGRITSQLTYFGVGSIVSFRKRPKVT